MTSLAIFFAAFLAVFFAAFLAVFLAAFFALRGEGVEVS